MVKIQDTVLHPTEMVSEDLLCIEMDLLVLWKILIKVMNTLTHNSPDFGVIMVSPEFWVRDWIGPIEANERVKDMIEHKNGCHVCRIGKFMPQFEHTVDMCTLFIDIDPLRESSWMWSEVLYTKSGESAIILPPNMCLNISH